MPSLLQERRIGGEYGGRAIGGAALLITLRGADPTPLFNRGAWTVLVFFAALFIVVAGLQKAGGRRPRWTR